MAVDIRLTLISGCVILRSGLRRSVLWTVSASVDGGGEGAEGGGGGGEEV